MSISSLGYQAGSSLPSIEDILASKHVLSVQDAQSTVVRVGEHFAVKYGHHVSLLEAENLKFLAESGVPVPQIHGFLTAPEGDKSFIIQEFIPGETLEQLMPSLTLAERENIFKQIQEALIQLRGLEPPSYIGSIGRKPLGDGIFYTEPLDAQTSGPFATQDQMNEGIIRRLAESCASSHVQLLRSAIESTLQGHKTVFTHADLQPKNIMVRRTVAEDGEGAEGFEVKIIDWEMSGWYPEYFEFCNASMWGSSKPQWLEAVQRIMAVYPREYLMMKVIRSIVYQLD